MKRSLKTTSLLLAVMLCLSLTAIPASAEGEAPTAQNLELTTYRGVSIGGKLEAEDPQGQELSFEITTQPVKGTVELGDDGCFVYTPKEGKKGRDYFGYRAVNADGERSQEATVIIRIEKQKTSVTYSDMKGDPAGFAAVRLAEEGVYIGKCVGGSYVFEPEEGITRAEFLAMCMELGDVQLLSSVSSTGFADDSDIPDWLKPCVSTALLNGYISGCGDGVSSVFCPDRTITLAEAAVMLGDVLDLSNIVTVSAYDEEVVPVWAASQTSGLAAREIISVSDGMFSELTRSDAAIILEKALEK